MTIHAHDSAIAASEQRGNVLGAIRTAARRTGVDFDYLLATAKRESSLNPTLEAKTSSATGLYQFIDQTWLGMVARHGDKYGAADAAAAITRGSDGRYEIADPATREAVLALRTDPNLSAAMAGEYARESAARLEAGLGHKPDSGALYAAHFLGAGGAVRLLKAAETLPHVEGAALFPEAARANRAIFYDQEGRGRTVAQVVDNLGRMHRTSTEDGSADRAQPDRSAGASARPVPKPSAPVHRGYLLSPDMIAMLADLDPLQATKRQSVFEA